MSGEGGKCCAEELKYSTVIVPPVGEPALSEEHELGRQKEAIWSGEDDSCCYRVLDARHDIGGGHPELLHGLRERHAVLKSGGGEALGGEQPAGEQRAFTIESPCASGHPVFSLEPLDRLMLRAAGDEVVHEARHAQEWVLGNVACEVLVSGREQGVRELSIHPVAVHEVLRGHRDERVGVCEPYELRAIDVEDWRSVEEHAPPGCLGL